MNQIAECKTASGVALNLVVEEVCGQYVWSVFLYDDSHDKAYDMAYMLIQDGESGDAGLARCKARDAARKFVSDLVKSVACTEFADWEEEEEEEMPEGRVEETC